MNGVDRQAIRIFIFPVYQLRFAMEKDGQASMQKMLRLLVTAERAGWDHAFGPYNYDDHKNLWERFTAVYVLSDGEVLDQHYRFMAETQSGHS